MRSDGGQYKKLYQTVWIFIFMYRANNLLLLQEHLRVSAGVPVRWSDHRRDGKFFLFAELEIVS